MIEVSKIIHDYYYTGASVKLHFNPVSTLGNTFKLRKDVSIMIRKYFFCYRVVNIWNNLPDYVVESDSINSSKSKSYS